jgi:hypothetical protein
MRKSVMLSLDARSIAALRELARERGIIQITGPAAGTGTGNISGLIRALAAEWLEAKRAEHPDKANVLQGPDDVRGN